jgi:hypothetical protein
VRQVAGVADGAARERVALLARGILRLRDVVRDRVDEMHLVALRGEPEGVHTRGAADVEDDRGWIRQVAAHDSWVRVRSRSPAASLSRSAST